MFNRILVATDGSEVSSHALLQTLPLARAEGSAVRVISVSPPYQGDLRLTGVKQHVSDMLVEPYMKALVRARKNAGDAGATIQTIFREGEPHEKIAETAEELGCDLIVTGVRDHCEAAGMITSSMAQRVLEYGCANVMVVPLKTNVSIDNILVAIDGSPQSNKALRLAFDFQRSYGSRIDVLTVADIPSHVYGISADFIEKRIGEARRRLEEAKDFVLSEAISAEFLLLEGNPSEVIKDTAKKRNLGLILMGSHGYSGLKRLFLGSVTERVVRTAECPVIISRS